MAETSHPLDWPEGYRRTPARHRTRSSFRISPRKVQKELIAEIERMGGRDIVISTDLRVRRSDGQPYARGLNRRSDDPGAAIYFRRRGVLVCLACDLHYQTWENIHAIGLTVHAMNAVGEHGTAQGLDRALQGFTAPPPEEAGAAGAPRWHDVLHVSPEAPAAVIGGAWRALSKQASEDEQLELNLARDEGLAACDRGVDAPRD